MQKPVGPGSFLEQNNRIHVLIGGHMCHLDVRPHTHWCPPKTTCLGAPAAGAAATAQGGFLPAGPLAPPIFSPGKTWTRAAGHRSLLSRTCPSTQLSLVNGPTQTQEGSSEGPLCG